MRLLACLGFAVSLAAQSLPPVRFLEISCAGWTIQSDLVYGSNLNPWTNGVDTLKLDVWEPKDDPATPRRPVLIYVHGGQWYYGDKTDGPVKLVLQNLCTYGWVGIAINYRLATSANHGGLAPTVVAEDAKAAVRWVRKNAAALRIDPERIAIGGDSVGANAAILVGYTTWAGNSGNPGFASNTQAVLDLWGRGLTPINDPKCGICIVHGDQDQANSYTGEALRMVAEAQTHGVFHQLVTLPGAAHAPWERWSEFWPRTTQTLYEALRCQELAGLTLVPGYASPGWLVWNVAAWHDDTFALFLSPMQANLQIPGLGLLQLDPRAIVWLWTQSFPSTPLVSAKFSGLPVPAGFQGALHLQGLYVRGAQALRLSNCATARFP